MAPPKKTKFRGNENLKAGFVTENITPEEFEFRTREIVKCRNDIVYFADHYYTIVAPKLGKHIIKTFPRQQELLRFMQNEERCCILSPRQNAKTTSMCIFSLHTALFNQDKPIFFAANRLKVAKNFIKRIKLAYELLPNWLKCGVKQWNMSMVEFSNGSTIEGDATSSDSGRSVAAEILLLDETAFIPNFLEFFGSIYPIISSAKGTKVIMCSTPNGTGNMFYEIYNSALLGTDAEGWKAFTMYWYDMPGKDEAWLAKTKASMRNEVLFNQNFMNNFTGSSYTLFKAANILKHKQFVTSEQWFNPKKIPFKNTVFFLDQWFEPLKDHSYLLCGDVADGIGQDFSVMHVFDITKGMNGIFEVASFSSNVISTIEFPYIMAITGTLYNNAYIAMESNSIGRSVFDALKSIYDYENFINYRTSKDPATRHTGIESRNQVKADACMLARELMDMMDVKIYDRYLVEELEFFEKMITKENVYCAKPGKHDDHVMALIWGLFSLQEKIIDKYFNVDRYFTTRTGYVLPMNISSAESTTSNIFTMIGNQNQNKVQNLENIYKNISGLDSQKQMNALPNPDNIPKDMLFFDNGRDNVNNSNSPGYKTDFNNPIWIKM